MKEIFQSFKKSLQRLAEILVKKKTVANRDSAIKRFELTFELAWKSLQNFLDSEGIICRSPRESLQAAFKFGLIKDDETWIMMLQDRNFTVHAYDEKFADSVYKRLGSYKKLFLSLEKNLKEKI